MKPLERVKVVMVETSHPGNIGAAARALKTMGLTQLVLVSPQDFPSSKAVWRAAGAADLLENAQVVDSFGEAIAECTLVIGASARERRIPWPSLDPKQCGDKIIEEVGREERVAALVFGREDRGLTNEELQACHYHVTIPGNEEYSVLNIAAAIQVIAYETRMSYLAKDLQKPVAAHLGLESEMRDWDEDLATSQDLDYFHQHLEKVLVDIDFHDPDNPRQLMTRLKRLFARVRMDKMELNILRGVLTAIEKSLKKHD